MGNIYKLKRLYSMYRYEYEPEKVLKRIKKEINEILDDAIDDASELRDD